MAIHQLLELSFFNIGERQSLPAPHGNHVAARLRDAGSRGGNVRVPVIATTDAARIGIYRDVVSLPHKISFVSVLDSKSGRVIRYESSCRRMNFSNLARARDGNRGKDGARYRIKSATKRNSDILQSTTDIGNGSQDMVVPRFQQVNHFGSKLMTYADIPRTSGAIQNQMKIFFQRYLASADSSIFGLNGFASSSALRSF